MYQTDRRIRGKVFHEIHERLHLKHVFMILVLCLTIGCGEEDNPVGSIDFQETATLTITNGLSLWTIFAIYISPAHESNWGIDRLGDGVLRPDYSSSIELSKGTYDIKIVDQDLDVYYHWGLTLNRNRTWRVTLSDLTAGKPVNGINGDE